MRAYWLTKVMYDWNFARLLPYAKAFGNGTVVTIELSVLIIVLGTLLGILLGLCVRGRWIRAIALPIFDAVRAMPPLVVILFFYYALTPQTIGWTINAYAVFVVAMSLHMAVFVADLMRASLDGLPKVLIESGRALGITETQALRHLYLNPLLRSSIAPLTGLYVTMIKTTSLASVINVTEIVHSAQTVTVETSRSLEAWIVVAIIYAVIVLPATLLLRRLEIKLRHQVQEGLYA